MVSEAECHYSSDKELDLCFSTCIYTEEEEDQLVDIFLNFFHYLYEITREVPQASPSNIYARELPQALIILSPSIMKPNSNKAHETQLKHIKLK